MEDDTHQSDQTNNQLSVMKTNSGARYRAQSNDRMTINFKRWIENGAPDKGDLEEDIYRVLREYLMQEEVRLYLNKDMILTCKRRDEDIVLYKYNAIVLQQLYQIEFF